LPEIPCDCQPFIVGIAGTVRPGSTSERAVIGAPQAAERRGARAQLFNGDFISSLPLYAPGQQVRNELYAQYKIVKSLITEPSPMPC